MGLTKILDKNSVYIHVILLNLTMIKWKKLDFDTTVLASHSKNTFFFIKNEITFKSPELLWNDTLKSNHKMQKEQICSIIKNWNIYLKNHD